MLGFGTVSIHRSGDCTGYNWDIKWTTGGNKPPIQISSSDLEGDSPTIVSTTSIDGGVKFIPIIDDMLRTKHSKPQVNVHINGIPSKCSSQCDFELVQSDSKPTVDSIDISSLPDIILIGTGFDSSDPSKNKVTIGNFTCDVTNVTASEIRCTIGDIPSGDYDFSVTVADKVSR